MLSWDMHDKHIQKYNVGVMGSIVSRQNDHNFADHLLKIILLNENCFCFDMIFKKYVPNGPINNTLALVQITAWHSTCEKSFYEPMMA